MRDNFMIVLTVCFLLFFFVIPSDLGAKNLLVKPSLGVKGQYDDNVVFVPTEEDDDFVFTISPAFELTFDSDLIDIQSDIIFDVLRYADNTDLDTVNQLYELNGAYRFQPRWSFSGLISYVKDTTLDDQLLETGRVREREDRRRFDIEGGLTHQLTEVSELGFNYHFKHVEFDTDRYVDYERNSAALSYSRKLKDEVNTLGAQLAYYYRDSDVSDLNEFTYLMSLEHLFSPQMRLFISGGVSYSKHDFKDDQSTDHYWKPIGHGYISWRGEASRFTFGYRRDIRTDTNGQAIDVDRIYCRVRRSLTQRWELGFTGRLYFSKDLDQSYDDGTRFFDVSPAIYYKLTENHALQLAYRYSNEKDRDRQDDQTADRNQIWLGLNFNFPSQWDY